MNAQTDFPKPISAEEMPKSQAALLRLAEYFTGHVYLAAQHGTHPGRTEYLGVRQYLGLFGDVSLPEAARIIRKTLGARPEVDHSTMREQWRALQRGAHDTSLAHGWWDEPASLATLLALVHCEVSEVVEADRAGNPRSEKIPAFTSIEEELADVVIRVLDLSEANGFRLFEAIMAKAAYNKTRPFKHGGKRY